MVVVPALILTISQPDVVVNGDGMGLGAVKLVFVKPEEMPAATLTTSYRISGTATSAN